MGHPLTTVGVIIPGMYNTNKNDSARLIKEDILCHDLLSPFCFGTQKHRISVGFVKTHLCDVGVVFSKVNKQINTV